MDIAAGAGSGARVLGLRRSIWHEALLAWSVQRVIIFGLLTAWTVLLHACPAAQAPGCVLAPLLRYDGGWYAGIATGGYTSLPQAAFSPLLPLLERILMPLTLGNPLAAGLVVAWGAELIALALLRELVELDAGAEVARRTLHALVLFPTSLFLVMPYSESLFLALCVGTFLAVRCRHWLLAGALAALASLTRQVGLLLLVPIAVGALLSVAKLVHEQRSLRAWLRRLWPFAVALALPVVTTAAWQWYLDRRLGVAGAVGRAAASASWRRYPSWPWNGLVRDLSALAHGGTVGATLGVARDVLFAALWIALALALVVRWRRWPLDYVLYAWASLLLVLVLPMHADAYDALNSLPRYLLMVFPCFAVVGRWWPASRRRAAVIVATLLVVLAAVVGVCVAGGFVA